MEKTAQFEDLKLVPGAKMTLHSDQYATVSGNCQFIGFRPKKAIIVSTPIKDGATVSCNPGRELAVRFFINSLHCACAFRTKVIQVSAAPFPHLYLEPPKTVEMDEVRKNARANTDLTCSIFTKELNSPKLVFIDNISANGAKVHSKTNFGKEGDKITINTQLEVLDLSNVVQISGVIRSVVSNGIDLIYGVEFVDLSDHAKLMIYAFVMTQLSNE